MPTQDRSRSTLSNSPKPSLSLTQWQSVREPAVPRAISCYTPCPVTIQGELTRNVNDIRPEYRTFLASLQRDSCTVKFGPGDIIVTKGQDSPELYVIAKGTVELLDNDHEVLACMEEGDFFGDVICSQPHSYSVRAAVPCDIYVVSVAQLQHLIDQFPRVMSYIDWTVKNAAGLNKTLNPMDVAGASSRNAGCGSPPDSQSMLPCQTSSDQQSVLPPSHMNRHLWNGRRKSLQHAMAQPSCQPSDLSPWLTSPLPGRAPNTANSGAGVTRNYSAPHTTRQPHPYHQCQSCLPGLPGRPMCSEPCCMGELPDRPPMHNCHDVGAWGPVSNTDTWHEARGGDSLPSRRVVAGALDYSGQWGPCSRGEQVLGAGKRPGPPSCLDQAARRYKGGSPFHFVPSPQERPMSHKAYHHIEGPPGRDPCNLGGLPGGEACHSCLPDSSRDQVAPAHGGPLPGCGLDVIYERSCHGCQPHQHHHAYVHPQRASVGHTLRTMSPTHNMAGHEHNCHHPPGLNAAMAPNGPSCCAMYGGEWGRAPSHLPPGPVPSSTSPRHGEHMTMGYRPGGSGQHQQASTSPTYRPTATAMRYTPYYPRQLGKTPQQPPSGWDGDPGQDLPVRGTRHRYGLPADEPSGPCSPGPPGYYAWLSPYPDAPGRGVALAMEHTAPPYRDSRPGGRSGSYYYESITSPSHGSTPSVPPMPLTRSNLDMLQQSFRCESSVNGLGMRGYLAGLVAAIRYGQLEDLDVLEERARLVALKVHHPDPMREDLGTQSPYIF